jgi:hypothetical protein
VIDTRLSTDVLDEGDEILEMHVEAIRDPGYGQSRVDHTPPRKRAPVVESGQQAACRREAGGSASSDVSRLPRPHLQVAVGMPTSLERPRPASGARGCAQSPRRVHNTL